MAHLEGGKRYISIAFNSANNKYSTHCHRITTRWIQHGLMLGDDVDVGRELRKVDKRSGTMY